MPWAGAGSASRKPKVATAWDEANPPGTNWNSNGYVPTSDPNQNPGGSRSGPGYAEQFWQQNQNSWMQPSASENYWNGIQGSFAPTSNTGVANAYNDWFRPSSDLSYAEQGAQKGPRGSNNTEIGLSSLLMEPGSRAEAFMDAGGPKYSNVGTRKMEGALSGVTNLTGSAAPGAMARMGQRTGLEVNALGENRSELGSSKAFDSFFDPLASGSYSERSLASDPSMAKYFERAAETGQERIDRASASRGLFGSGAALDESRELAKDLGAEEAKSEADYRLKSTGQADANRLGRMDLAGKLGSAKDEAVNAQADDRLSWMKAADDSMFRRDDSSRSWAGQGDTLSLAKSKDTRDWSSLIDDTELRQSEDKRKWTADADADRARRDQLRFGYSTKSDENSLARSAEDRAWATAGDTSRNARSADARSWADLLDTGSRADQRLNLDRATQGADVARNLDRTRLDQYESGMRGASTAEGAQRNRLNDQFDQLFKVGSAQSGATSASGNAGIEDFIKLLQAQIDAKMGRASNNRNEVTNDQNQRDQGYSHLLQLFGML